MDPSALGRAAVTFAFLLSALGFALWRQSRAFEEYRTLDDVSREVLVAQAERVELQREIQVLQGRARIVPLARARLGMHTPDASEQVILAGDASS